MIIRRFRKPGPSDAAAGHHGSGGRSIECTLPTAVGGDDQPRQDRQSRVMPSSGGRSIECTLSTAVGGGDQLGRPEHRVYAAHSRRRR